MDPKVVHCKKDKFDIYIGRPSKWRNPFRIGIDGDRAEVIKRYAMWLYGDIAVFGIEKPPSYEEIKKELKGKILGCYCSPLPCHGDILAKIANEENQ